MINASKIFSNLFDKAYRLNRENILSLLEKNSSAILLDLGCDSGKWTIELEKKVAPLRVIGVDVSEKRLKIAEENGIETIQGNLDRGIPLEDSSVSVIHANQVIEHLSDLHVFAEELFRVLKPGGYIVISTENTSSWHNIFASLLGWQVFSATNITPIRGGVGNPLAFFRGSEDCYVNSNWTHKTLFGYLGLKEFFETYGFEVTAIKGAGYYPLPSKLGLIDPRHAHFITIKAYKNEKHSKKKTSR